MLVCVQLGRTARASVEPAISAPKLGGLRCAIRVALSAPEAAQIAIWVEHATVDAAVDRFTPAPAAAWLITRPAGACEFHVRYALCMTVNVQIRNVPEELANELKVRAAARRQSLSDYLLGELEQIAETPPLDDWLEERLAQPRRVSGITGADAVREARAEMGWD